MAARYSRVTVVGTRRRLDTVLPSDEPVGRLLPDVLRLLDEPISRPPRPRHLVTRTGAVLASDATLATAEIADGSVLELVGVDDSPPAPVVHDVTEETADGLARRSWRWGPAARRWTATGAGSLALLLGAAFLRELVPGAAALVWLTVLAGAGCLLGVALGRVREPLGTGVLLAASGVGLAAAWTAGEGWPGYARWALLAGLAAILLALHGVATPLGRAGLVGGAFGLVLTGLWLAGALLELPAERLAAVLAAVSIILVGLLPRIALSSAGLTRLDDRLTGGAEVTRRDVTTALDAAYRALGFAVLATAGSAALAGWLLAAHPNRWTAPLAGLLVVILLSRARTYPLVGEVLSLLVAAVVVLVALLLAWRRGAGEVSVAMPLALAVVAAGCLALVAVEPPPHVQARLRRIADRIEMVAVVAALPVVVGVFGVYGRLLHAF
ncbi:type VII secretion integral membrane protein EccD [Micromonospora sp. NPDC049559]|uniref:type VII secretion integral membrane protein EccD n=1 Tax=Micromonospora sp. NPDC049559 TaxID=3155923 RepID=UPI0034430627